MNKLTAIFKTLLNLWYKKASLVCVYIFAIPMLYIITGILYNNFYVSNTCANLCYAKLSDGKTYTKDGVTEMNECHSICLEKKRTFLLPQMESS
jgi:hypothetical protein